MRTVAGWLVAVALLAPTSDSTAQGTTYWRVPASVGGAMVGAGAGWAMDIVMWQGQDCGLCGPALNMTPIGIGAGALIGLVAGTSADARLARGDTLSRAARGWLRFTTFLTPVAVGSLVTFLIVNPPDEGHYVTDANGTFYDERAKFLDDATVAVLGIGGGVALGAILQGKFARALHPRVSVSPGGFGLSLSASF